MMALMTGRSEKSKLMFVAMFGMIGVRLSIFALSTVGLVAWAPRLGESVLSWIMPVGIPIVMISYMLLFRRRGMMQQMRNSSDEATPLKEILQKRLALGEITKDQYEDMRRIILGEEHSQ
jgi:uncharacterized membrane protein